MKMPYSEETWDRVAQGYEGGYDAIAERSKWVAPQVLTELALPYLIRDSPILDVGCGTGLSGAGFITQGFVLDGIDFSLEMCLQARKRGYQKQIKAELTHSWDLGYLKQEMQGQYHNMISVGVYGESILAQKFRFLFPLLNAKATVAVAGEANAIEHIIDEDLQNYGFALCAEERSIAYTNRDLVPIEYLYLVAVRE